MKQITISWKSVNTSNALGQTEHPNYSLVTVILNQKTAQRPGTTSKNNSPPHAGRCTPHQSSACSRDHGVTRSLRQREGGFRVQVQPVHGHGQTQPIRSTPRSTTMTRSIDRAESTRSMELLINLLQKQSCYFITLICYRVQLSIHLNSPPDVVKLIQQFYGGTSYITLGCSLAHEHPAQQAHKK